MDREELILEAMNEVFAAAAYITEHGSIEIKSPQARALISTVRKLMEVTGKEPMIPQEWPWSRES